MTKIIQITRINWEVVKPMIKGESKLYWKNKHAPAEIYIKCLFIPHDYMSVFFCRPIMTIHVCDEAKNCKFLGVISYLVLNILENENFVVFNIITL